MSTLVLRDGGRIELLPGDRDERLRLLCTQPNGESTAIVVLRLSPGEATFLAGALVALAGQDGAFLVAYETPELKPP